MNFVGIIAEYDPFHSGHALQLRMLRQRGASTIAVCMSTGVVQRGGVPILPEAVRVRAALAAGADLVVALPAPYANASAEQFAAAGVHLLAALGCDTLAFGAETPEPAPLQAAAAALCSAAFPAALRSQLESGLPFAAARAAAAETLCPGAADLLQTPNNILGIEYCKPCSCCPCRVWAQPMAPPRPARCRGRHWLRLPISGSWCIRKESRLPAPLCRRQP